MVGFTKLGEGLPVDQIGEVTGRFAEIVADVVEPPVRLVKLIGDAAMLVSRRPEPLLEAALGLLEAVAEEGPGFPPLRIGATWGAAISRGGDWFGRPINLASRLTTAARPSSLLIDEALRDAVVPDGFEFSDAGHKNLKGIGSVHVLRVRRAPLPSDPFRRH